MVVEEELMFKVFALVLLVSVVFVAASAQAYGIAPTGKIQPTSAGDLQIAQACVQQLTPKMAAAFGLPVLDVRQCGQG